MWIMVYRLCKLIEFKICLVVAKPNVFETFGQPTGE